MSDLPKIIEEDYKGYVIKYAAHSVSYRSDYEPGLEYTFSFQLGTNVFMKDGRIPDNDVPHWNVVKTSLKGPDQQTLKRLETEAIETGVRAIKEWIDVRVP